MSKDESTRIQIKEAPAEAAGGKSVFGGERGMKRSMDRYKAKKKLDEEGFDAIKSMTGKLKTVSADEEKKEG